ncbi:hypothetical protein P3X46_025103 [Hevea brasiliensis]|uniref:DUF4283 domain-containing protein n=1 Tax=Hevea brasiliensis TaxID=3981 RepID=A0ABQ9L614_HEVBR|nr:hypothetical protein P3X46_025103 [Hevea brasiliensis]
MWLLRIHDEEVIVDKTSPVSSIVVPEGVQRNFMKKMEKSMVIRLLGRKVGYRALCNKVQSLWNRGSSKVLDLGNDWFLVQFSSNLYYQSALLDGPWTMLGSYLIVKPWTMDFKNSVTDVDSMVVWVCFPGLPLHFYNKQLLRKIGGALGSVIKIDYNTNMCNGSKVTHSYSWQLARPSQAVSCPMELTSVNLYRYGVRNLENA